MFRKKNSNSKTTVLCIHMLIVSSMSLTGCDQLPNPFDRKADNTDTYKVKVPKTAPLEAGSSVTDSIIKNNQQKSHQNNVILQPVKNNPEKTSQKQLKKETNILLVDKPASNKTDSIVSGEITSGTPAATVQKALDALYYSSAKEAASYHVNKKDIDKILAKMQPVIQNKTKSVKIIKTSYSADKSSAIVDVLFQLKGGQKGASYQLKKLKGKWVIWID